MRLGCVEMSKQTKDLIVILVMVAIIIAGFYFALKSGTNFKEVD